MRCAAVILAAGQGTRMHSKRQKTVHAVGGKPMVQHAFDAVSEIVDIPPVVIVGPGGDEIRQLLGDRATYVVQEEQLGTGHATQLAHSVIGDEIGQVIVANADMPLVRRATYQRMVAKQVRSGAVLVVLTVIGDPESSFGRVRRNAEGTVCEIVEVAEAKQRSNARALLALREQNVGIFCFEATWLWDNIGDLPRRQARHTEEYYVTDLVSIAAGHRQPIEAIVVEDADECLGAGTRSEMLEVERAFRRRANDHWMDHGVTIVEPRSTFIDQTVHIGMDTVIWPNTFLQGDVTIGEDCVLGPNATIRDANIGAGCHIEQSIVENVMLPDGTRLKPFTVLSGDK